MISLWELPILIVLENNHIAQTTPVELAVAGSIPQRFEAFGITTAHIDSSDILEIAPLAKELIHRVRADGTPQALIIDTARLGTHSKGDDTRSQEFLEKLWQTRDPLVIQGKRLSAKERDHLDDLVQAQIQSAFEAALAVEGGCDA
jgi:TPP-dependent pyruvate/acetoin dehydrogenase alpha subunit